MCIRDRTTARHWPSGTSFSRLCPHPARRLHLTRDLCRSYYHLYRQSTLLSGKLTHCTAAGPDTRYTVVSITCCLQSIEMSCTGFRSLAETPGNGFWHPPSLAFPFLILLLISIPILFPRVSHCISYPFPYCTLEWHIIYTIQRY